MYLILFFYPVSHPCSKDVRLPVQLQRAMAAEAEAAREARAKVKSKPAIHCTCIVLLHAYSIKTVTILQIIVCPMILMIPQMFHATNISIEYKYQRFKIQLYDDLLQVLWLFLIRFLFELESTNLGTAKERFKAILLYF